MASKIGTHEWQGDKSKSFIVVDKISFLRSVLRSKTI